MALAIAFLAYPFITAGAALAIIAVIVPVKHHAGSRHAAPGHRQP
jgi:hypothetical protein